MPEPEAKKAKITRTSWTYDEPCAEMEWNAPPSASVSVGTFDDIKSSDLVIFGIFGPPEADDSGGDEKMDGTTNEEEAPTLCGKVKECDEELKGALSAVMKENAKTFKGGSKAGSNTPVLLSVVDGKAKKYTVLGLGKPTSPKPDKSTVSPGGVGLKIGSAIAKICTAEKAVTTCAVVLPIHVLTFDETNVIRDIAGSFYCDLYSDNRYRTGDNVKIHAERLTNAKIIVEGEDPLVASTIVDSAESIEEGKILARGQFLSKDIVNAPHNVLNSISMANVAKRIASESKGVLTCTVLDKTECEKLGMGAYLAVARGSETEPQFIHLVYKPNDGEIRRKVGVIGKGLLFDTGGYNIKTAMMELMKFDCGGAAAVFGAARAIADIQPEGVEVHFIVAACENMISSKAYVPSDVLTASNGKTIEVNNTDAEGRLTLADALVYADKKAGCERIIELSTLTGACMVSLGKQICGIWTSNDELATDLETVSRSTGEKSWRMPLASEYNEHIESIIADMKNTGVRWGGAISAALFLQNFVDKKKPFAHIDLAGPVWNEKTGATGFGAKMVTEWIRLQGK